MIIKQRFEKDGKKLVNELKIVERADGQLQIYVTNGKSKDTGHQKYGAIRLNEEHKIILRDYLNMVVK